MRKIYSTPEYQIFYNSLSDRVKNKIEYSIYILKEIPVVSTKLVKKLINTNLYELRISVDNEYRIILFCMDNENIINATKIIFLSGFVKKSTKDYGKQIKQAETILNNLKP